MNAICESSLYNKCLCKSRYHLPLNLPLYDSHCHVDLFFKYGLNQNEFNATVSNGRKITLIDNRHQYYRWFTNYDIQNSNVKIFTTYGIHPKYLPTDPQRVLEQLNDIFQNKFHLNTSTVAIGECGLDETSNCSTDHQLHIFQCQLKLAAQLNLPVVLHARGNNLFQMMLRELKLHLHDDHHIHWHCINCKSDLDVISDFLNYFKNGVIGLNGSITMPNDNDYQKSFHKWLLTRHDIVDRIVIETDFPFLPPSALECAQYNPITGITIVAQHIVDILRIKHFNTTKMIYRSNNNIRRIYSID